VGFWAGVTNAEEPSAPTCPACRKTDGMVDCPACGGTKKCPDCTKSAVGPSEEDCECGGSGICQRCKGTGKVPCEHPEEGD